MSTPQPSDARSPQRPPGWRVEPPRRPQASWRRVAWLMVVTAVLLAFNYWAASRATHHPRVRIPYSPFFLGQVRGGNVESITSKGTTIAGLFEHATSYAESGKTRRCNT